VHEQDAAGAAAPGHPGPGARPAVALARPRLRPRRAPRPRERAIGARALACTCQPGLVWPQLESARSERRACRGARRSGPVTRARPPRCGSVSCRAAEAGCRSVTRRAGARARAAQGLWQEPADGQPEPDQHLAAGEDVRAAVLPAEAGRCVAVHQLAAGARRSRGPGLACQALQGRASANALARGGTLSRHWRLHTLCMSAPLLACPLDFSRSGAARRPGAAVSGALSAACGGGRRQPTRGTRWSGCAAWPPGARPAAPPLMRPLSGAARRSANRVKKAGARRERACACGPASAAARRACGRRQGRRRRSGRRAGAAAGLWRACSTCSSRGASRSTPSWARPGRRTWPTAPASSWSRSRTTRPSAPSSSSAQARARRGRARCEVPDGGGAPPWAAARAPAADAAAPRRAAQARPSSSTA